MFDASTIADMGVLSLATAAVSVTITRSSLTAPWSKRWRHIPQFGELINCPYCMSHWVALGMSLMALTQLAPAAFMIAICAVIGAACLWIGLLQRLWLFQESEIEELRDLLREAQAALEKQEKTS